MSTPPWKSTALAVRHRFIIPGFSPGECRPNGHFLSRPSARIAIRSSAMRTWRNCFLEVFFDYRKQEKYSIHAFVLMPDHLHALLTPAEMLSLEKAMQFIQGGSSFRRALPRWCQHLRNSFHGGNGIFRHLKKTSSIKSRPSSQQAAAWESVNP